MPTVAARPPRKPLQPIAPSSAYSLLRIRSMLYRKTPLAPPKLLLRIAAGLGSGALLGFGACSSSNAGNDVLMGSVPNPGDDASVVDGGCCGLIGSVANHDAESQGEEAGHLFTGSLGVPDNDAESGGPEAGADATSIMVMMNGIAPLPEDSGASTTQDAENDGALKEPADDASPDSGRDGAPRDAAQDGFTGCPGICGIVVNPED
jgi:hypothetical protein